MIWLILQCVCALQYGWQRNSRDEACPGAPVAAKRPNWRRWRKVKRRRHRRERVSLIRPVASATHSDVCPVTQRASASQPEREQALDGLQAERRRSVASGVGAKAITTGAG